MSKKRPMMDLPLHDQIYKTWEYANQIGGEIVSFVFNYDGFSEEQVSNIMMHLSEDITKKTKWAPTFINTHDQEYHLYIVKDPLYVYVLNNIYDDYYRKGDFITFTVLQYKLLGYSKEMLDKKLDEICDICEDNTKEDV